MSRDYEAGYRDGSIHYELEHCPACKNVADLQEALAENAKLREQVERLRTQLADVTESVGRVEERCAKTFEVGKRWMAKAARFEAENAKLREQMERLVTLLRADCDIEASWDGLRKFWLIGLTENGCLMRDRACKAEAENAKLRELIGAGTCEADETDLIPFVRADSGDFEVDYIHVMECTECGHTYEHVNGDYEYCPRCGRKRRDVEE